MLWSLIKIFIFIGLAAALTFGAAQILETPGEVKIAFGSREVFLSPIGFLISILVLLLVAYLLIKLMGLVAAVFHFLMGDETALTRYFSRGRERRGFNALTDAMIGVESGDAKFAKKNAAKAEKLLSRTEATQLVSARVAEMDGDRSKAQSYYKDMLANDRTRFVGIKGLMDQKLAEGDRDTALELAKKAFALRPGNEPVLRTLFDLQSEKADWAGARQTLNASVHAKLLPRDVGTRRDAVLSLADARAAAAAGDTARANTAALQANKLAPTFIPAAAMASAAHVAQNSRRRAVKTLTAAWNANPHPDLAAAYAAIVPDETPAARRARFAKLTAVAPDDPESRLLLAELALADEDFPAARKALGDLAESNPTTRSLAVMAAIERGQGAPDAVVRGWLAKALNASRGPQWICGKCNHVHEAWEPVCDNCGAFDTLDWKTPPHSGDTGLAQSAMLPLIVGSLEDDTRPAASETPASSARADAAAEDAVTDEAPASAKSAPDHVPNTRTWFQDEDASVDKGAAGRA